ncbi:MAG TPA: hypothetical protein VJN68_10080 [Burkholderiaceae bacterium]|nr:hypothetical protein [Burkholderiaceae bacterium]
MSFADTERRATAAIFRRFPNAQATFAHTGVITPVVTNVVFDPALAVVDETLGVVVNRPALLMTPDSAPLTAEGDLVTLQRLTDPVEALGVFKVRAVLPIGEGGMQRVALVKA